MHTASFDLVAPIHTAAGRTTVDAYLATASGHIRQAVTLHHTADTLRGIADAIARAHSVLGILEANGAL